MTLSDRSCAAAPRKNSLAGSTPGESAAKTACASSIRSAPCVKSAIVSTLETALGARLNRNASASPPPKSRSLPGPAAGKPVPGRPKRFTAPRRADEPVGAAVAVEDVAGIIADKAIVAGSGRRVLDDHALGDRESTEHAMNIGNEAATARGN